MPYDKAMGSFFPLLDSLRSDNPDCRIAVVCPGVDKPVGYRCLTSLCAEPGNWVFNTPYQGIALLTMASR